MTLQELKNLANSPKYTPEIKSIIKREAEKYGLTIPNCKCRNKWNDVIMQMYNIERKKEISKVVRPYIKTNNPNIFRYKRTRPSRVNGKIYDNNTPKEDIEALKRRYPRLFEAFYEERCVPISVDAKGIKDAIKRFESQEEVNFYPQDAEGTIRKEVENENN